MNNTRGQNNLALTGEIGTGMELKTAQEFAHQLNESILSEKGNNQSFYDAKEAGVQVTRNQNDNLDSSEVGTMYLRQGRNSSIGTGTQHLHSPTNGLGLSHYKNTYSPQRPGQGLPGL